MIVETEKAQNIVGLCPEYKSYEHQKCFVGHSQQAEWRDDILSACAEVLPKFGLEPWYAADHFDPTKPLRDKVVELIANARYGIYDLSSWQDRSGEWHLPRNVFIELGMAIVLNRPTLLLRHTSNKALPLPAGLQGVDLLSFAGETTLKRALEEQVPQWLDVSPDRDWLNRFCIFGNRVCSFREEYPRARQWGQGTLRCHISDGLDKDHACFQEAERSEIRGAFEDIFSRYSDLAFDYLDELSPIDGYQFTLCSYCQTVRSTPFAVYRISPQAPTEAFIAIGMSIALEAFFEYDIPKVLMVRQEQDLPSLLRGYEVVEATSSSEVKRKLKVFVPAVMQKVRETVWKPRLLPFVETVVFPSGPRAPGVVSEHPYVLIVDDSEDNRQRLVGLFQTIGCETREAGTNSQALDLLSNSGIAFSLLTTDARRDSSAEEDYAGLDLVRVLNQRFSELPVIIVSRNSPGFLREKAADLRVDGVLDKNLSDEEIVAAVQKVLTGESLPNAWSHQPKHEDVSLNKGYISDAIYQAALAVGGRDHSIADRLADQVVALLKETTSPDHVPSIEQIHDTIEKVLIENGYANTAKTYILNRATGTYGSTNLPRLSKSPGLGGRKGGPKFTQVVKRTGAIVPFTPERITNAIYRAAVAVGGHDRATAEKLTDQVIALMEQQMPPDHIPAVEEIQDAVEKVLIENGHAKVAKHYILYRDERARLRYQKTRRTSLVATFGLNVNKVLTSKQLPVDVPTDYPSLCDWLEEDLRRRLHDRIGDFQYPEASKRDGETLSVRIAFQWQQQDGQPDLGNIGWWSLELAPFEEIYPGQRADKF